MKHWILYTGLCVMLTACYMKAEQDKDDPQGAQPDLEMLQQARQKQRRQRMRAFAGYTSERDTADLLHASLLRYAVTDGPMGTDTVYHYPVGSRIEVGMHLGDKLYLELGDFYNDMFYNGAMIYWGDSLIYATGLDVVNDWHTCHVHHVDSTDLTYVLLLLDGSPDLPLWHIVCMDGENIRLADHVPAGNDYMDARYFHDNVIYEDLDGDGIIEVGGKRMTQLWADSMTYEPCYIYKLGRQLTFDEAASERETRKAHYGTFLGFKKGLHMYNPNEEEHEAEPDTESEE